MSTTTTTSGIRAELESAIADRGHIRSLIRSHSRDTTTDGRPYGFGSETPLGAIADRLERRVTRLRRAIRRAEENTRRAAGTEGQELAAGLGFSAALEIRPGDRVNVGGRPRVVEEVTNTGKDWPGYKLRDDTTDRGHHLGAGWVSWMNCGQATG